MSDASPDRRDEDERVDFRRAVEVMAELRRNGRPVNACVLRRWATNGVRGIVLESELQGGRRVTTPRWIRQFLAALNARATQRPDDGERREWVSRRLSQLGI